MIHSIALASFAALVSLLALWVADKIALGSQLLDKPDQRKTHAVPVPLIGGVGLSLTLACCGLVGLVLDFATWPSYGIGLGAALCIIFLVGLVDDRRPIEPKARLLAQVLAALCVIFLGGTVVRNLGDVFLPIHLGLGSLSLPFTIAAIVGVVNAYNMSDGADGLCGGYCLTSLIWLLACTIIAGATDAEFRLFSELSAVIIPAISFTVVFLVIYNYRVPGRQHARAFLGDSGSMALGLIVVWLTIRMNGEQTHGDGVPPVTLLCIVAVPLADMFASMFRRVFVAGSSPLKPDRMHIHHLLQSVGITHARSVNLLILANLLVGFIGVACWQAGIPQYVVFWLLGVGFVAYLRKYTNAWEVHLKAETKGHYWQQENELPPGSTRPTVRSVDVAE